MIRWLEQEGNSIDTVIAVEKGATEYTEEQILPNFGDFEFYTGPSMNPNGMYVGDIYCNDMELLY
jgi:hypothetical protein